MGWAEMGAMFFLSFHSFGLKGGLAESKVE